METTSTTLSAPAAAAPAHGPRLAGDLAIWFFILAELLAFGVFFAAYAFTRANNIELFNAEQAGLNRNAGALNTILLLTASYFVVRAVQAAEREASRQAANWLLGAIVTGYLGSFLMAGAFLAIGICMSALTRNQVVSFILSVVVSLLFILAGMAACPIRNQAAIPVKSCPYKADYL